jgi:hypothetical protein
MTPKALGEILKTLLENGFELPFHFAIVGRNGQMMAGHYQADEGGDGLVCSLELEGKKGSAFAVPINLMFVDSAGEAARVVIGPDGQATISVN